LLIVDVAHPANPKITGQTGLGLFGTQWQISDLAVDDHYAYLLDDEVGLRVVDIANPVSPVEVGFLHFPGYPDSIALVADYIYVTARESGLFVFQVTPD
jgi:hypothetical protein